MKRLIALVGAVALAAALSIPAPVVAAPGVVGDWQTHRQLQSPVEQESPNFFFNNCGGLPNGPLCDPATWVTNPTDCAWDADDHDSDFSSGTLGGTVTDTKCVIADGFNNFGGDAKHVEISVTAKVGSLLVTLDDSLGNQWVAPAIKSGSTYTYITCTTEDYPGPFYVIPGSNGGTGVQITYTATISAAHKANGVSAVFQVYSTAGYFDVACP